MKAIDYVKKFRECATNPSIVVYEGQPEGFVPDVVDFALLICKDITREVHAIATTRKAKSDSALLAIFVELNQKWVACVRLLAKEGYEVPQETFQFYVAAMTPRIAAGLGWKCQKAYDDSRPFYGTGD